MGPPMHMSLKKSPFSRWHSALRDELSSMSRLKLREMWINEDAEDMDETGFGGFVIGSPGYLVLVEWKILHIVIK